MRTDMDTMASTVPEDAEHDANPDTDLTEDERAWNEAADRETAERRDRKQRVGAEVKQRYLVPEDPLATASLDQVIGRVAADRNIGYQTTMREMGITRDRSGRFRLKLPGGEQLAGAYEPEDVLKAFLIGARNAESIEDPHKRMQQQYAVVRDVLRYLGADIAPEAATVTIPPEDEGSPTLPEGSPDVSMPGITPDGAPEDTTPSAPEAAPETLPDAHALPERLSEEDEAAIVEHGGLLQWLRKNKAVRRFIQAGIVLALLAGKAEQPSSGSAESPNGEGAYTQTLDSDEGGESFVSEASPDSQLLEAGETFGDIAGALLEEAGVEPTPERVFTVTNVLTAENDVAMTKADGTKLSPGAHTDRTLPINFEVRTTNARAAVETFRSLS